MLFVVSCKLAVVESGDIISAGTSTLKTGLSSFGYLTCAVMPLYSTPDGHLLRVILPSWPRPERRRTVTGYVGSARRMDDAKSRPMDPLPKMWRDGGSIMLGDMKKCWYLTQP